VQEIHNKSATNRSQWSLVYARMYSGQQDIKPN